MNDNSKKIQGSSEKAKEYLRELVAARIEALSDDLEIFFGEQNYTREQLVQNIKEGTELGQEIVELQLKYLQDMAAGKIYQTEDKIQGDA